MSLLLLYTWSFVDTSYVCCQFQFFFLSFHHVWHCNIVSITAIGVLSPGLHLGVVYFQKVVDVPGTPVSVI